MKRRLVAGTKTNVRSIPLDEWYRRLLKQQYERLGAKNKKGTVNVGLSEVKLRLFLSLLDAPDNLEKEKVAANQ
jgi:hypothetical protein